MKYNLKKVTTYLAINLECKVKRTITTIVNCNKYKIKYKMATFQLFIIKYNLK